MARDEVFDGLAKELAEGLVVPALIGSAEKDNGVHRLLKALRHECPLPARAAEPTSGAEAARVAIARLPESQRVILHLYRQEGLSFEQIAEVLGTTPEAVRSRASAAYQKLQVELRPYLRANGGHAR